MALSGLAACRGTAPTGTMHVLVVRAVRDSTVFTAADVAHPCRGGGVLFDAVNGANGILAWVRAPAPLTAGSFPLLGRGDTLTPRGALVAVRFLAHDIAHGFPVDSGTLTLSATGKSYRGRIQGSGTDLGSAVRGAVDVTIDSVTPRPDTLACGAPQ